MAWTTALPTWLLGTLTVVIFVLIAIIGLLLTRRLAHGILGSPLLTNDAIEPFFSGGLVFYGITLGLITVATWENYASVSDTVSSEAAAIAALYRDVSGYPEPLRSTMKQELYDYTRYIVDEVWPAQGRGEVLEEGTFRLNDFQAHLFAFEPETNGQSNIHEETLGAFNDLVELRRLRIESAVSRIPSALWVVVLIGAAFTVGLAYTFRVEDVKLHAFLVGTTAALIALLVFVIYTLDTPYQGDVRIPPRAYQLVIDNLIALDNPNPG